MFKREIGTIQSQHVPVRVRGKYCKIRECWLTKSVEGLISKNKEAYGGYNEMLLQVYRGYRRKLKKEIRRAI